MEIRSIGIDLGKTTFHLVALGRRGEVLVHRKFTQKQLLTYTANLQTCLFAKTPAQLRMAMPEILENAENDLTPQMRNLLELLWEEWKMVEQQIGVLSQELERIADTDAGCRRIQQIPGIGPVVATAIVAAIGNGAAFRKGREFAAWLGLVPRQYSTGGKARLLGISKRGNTYLRKILVHGARAAVLRIKRDKAPIGAWMDALERRAHRNVLIVAFANKLARIAWAVLSTGEPYRPCTSAVTQN